MLKCWVVGGKRPQIHIMYLMLVSIRQHDVSVAHVTHTDRNQSTLNITLRTAH